MKSCSKSSDFEWLWSVACPSALALTVLAAFACTMFWKADDPLRTYGDPYSDWSVLQAGTFFAEEGFVENYFLPKRNAFPPYYYTHYPPLPDLANGVVRSLGFDRMCHFRFLPIMASLLGLAFWWAFVERAIDSWVATLSLFVLAFSPVFYWFADSLHEHSYSIFFLFASFYFWGKFCGGEGEKFLPYGALAWGMAFLQSLASFEYILFTHVFFFGYSWLVLERRPGRWPWMMLSAPFAGFALHLLQNAWLMGSMANAVVDLSNALFRRTFSIASQRGRPIPSLESYLRAIDQRLGDVLPDAAMALVLLLVLLTLVLLWFYGERFPWFPESARARSSLRMVLVLGTGGVAWWLAFPQHTWFHDFVARHMVPAWALLIASGIVVAIRMAWRIGRFNRTVALLPCLFAVTLCSLPAKQTAACFRDCDLSFRYVPRSLLGSVFPPDAVIFVTPPFPWIAHSIHRPYLPLLITAGEIAGAVRAVQEAEPGRPCFYVYGGRLEDSPLCRFLMQYGVETYHYEENKIVIEVYELDTPAILELLERQSAGRTSAASKSEGALP